MRRIDEVKRKKIKNVKFVEILDKKRVKIIFSNNDYITLVADVEDYGYDVGIYLRKIQIKRWLKYDLVCAI